VEFPVIPFAKKHIEQKRKQQAMKTDEEKQASEQKHEDLLSHMLELRNKNPEVLDDFEVVKTCGQFVFAGNDTMSVSVRKAMYP
jgi:cytochrome P450